MTQQQQQELEGLEKGKLLELHPQTIPVKVSFMHMKFFTNEGRVGRVTAAYYLVGKTLVYGLSLCAPNDQNKWNRRYGNAVAESRLDKQKNFAGQIELDTDQPSIDMIEIALRQNVREVRAIRKGGGAPMVLPLWMAAVSEEQFNTLPSDVLEKNG